MSRYNTRRVGTSGNFNMSRRRLPLEPKIHNRRRSNGKTRAGRIKEINPDLIQIRQIIKDNFNEENQRKVCFAVLRRFKADKQASIADVSVDVAKELGLNGVKINKFGYPLIAQDVESFIRRMRKKGLFSYA